MNKDHIEGAFDEAKGTVKDAVGGVAGDAKTQAEGKADKFVGRAQQAWGDARDTIDNAASEAADAAADLAAEAEPKLRHAAEAVRAKASAVGGKMYEAGTAAGSTVASTVKEQPLLALIGVAAVGYLAGYLLHSPSSPFAPEPRYRRVVRRWS
jgi:uncharacterized protein YjbJ (UPF0337 family)